MTGKLNRFLGGEEDMIKKVIDFCQKGTPHSMIKEVDVKWGDYKGEFRGFRIKWSG